MKITNLRQELKQYKKDIIDKVLMTYDDIEDWSVEYWTKDIMETLCNSFAAIIVNFVQDNKDYILTWCEYDEEEDDDVEDYLENFEDEVITSNGEYGPFALGEPKEFFNELESFVSSFLIPELMKHYK